MAESHTSINIPQIIAVAIVGFFAIRWFMTKSPASGGSASSTRRGQQVDLTKIEQVASVFPQLDRRTIAWDLHQNGGSVTATTERVLGGRTLDNPPPSYQPNLPSANTQAPAVGQRADGKRSGNGQPDLITRYGLQGKVSGKGKEPVPSEEQRRNAWSSDKAARADGLKKRREEMVLAARRRLEANDTGA